MIDQKSKDILVEHARQARAWAYAPYSKYTVGAALLASSGRIYEGVNIENAVYPLGICAERVAIFKSVSEGEMQFLAIAVVTEDGGTPCGSCRQVLSEFGLDTVVIIADSSGNISIETTVGDLLPKAFSLESRKK